MTQERQRLKPAQLLEGVDLGNGWHVLQPLELPEGHTGGFFSYGYEVEHEDGRKGYLKALDFFEPLYYSDDPAAELLELTEGFVYERDLLEHCRVGGLTRVVRSLDHGTVHVEGFGDGVAATVQYLIFELAEGDVRKKLALFDDIEVAWALRSLHHVAVGLRQLHTIHIAHQDLKPSNVLLFDNESSSKVGDLGRGTHRLLPAPHEDALVAGERSYAPPESLYRDPPSDWRARRLGCDLYLLGSMVVFYFTGLSATALLFKHVPDELHWLRWSGPYYDILPHLQQGFGEMLEYLAPNVPPQIRDLIVATVRELCEPDPRRRGHPKNHAAQHGNPYALDRYVSRFDLAARRAEIHLRGRRI